MQNLSTEQKLEFLFQKIQELESKNNLLEKRIQQLEAENEKNVEEEDLQFHTQKKIQEEKDMEKKLKEEYLSFENDVKEDPTSYYKHWDELLDLNSKLQSNENKCQTLGHLFEFIQYHEKKNQGKIIRTLLLRDNQFGNNEANCILHHLQNFNANLVKIDLQGNCIDQMLLSSINELLQQNCNTPTLALKRLAKNSI
jgi:hypothetical protein